MCAEYCYHDGQCPAEQKCCPTTCGHACSEPCWFNLREKEPMEDWFCIIIHTWVFFVPFNALFIGTVSPVYNHLINLIVSVNLLSVVEFFGHKITKKTASLKSWYFWYASVHLDVLFSLNSSLASVLRNVQVPLPETQTRAKRLVMKETSVSILSRSLAAKGSKRLSAKTWQWWKSLELKY